MQRIAVFLFALLFPFAAFAQGPPGGCGFPAQPCNIQGTPSAAPIPTVPGPLVYLGKQVFTAATLASSTALTVPTGATIIDIYPECVTDGTDNQCVRYDPGTTASATTSAGLASQQDILGYSGSISTMQFILAAGATGATANALVIHYYRAGP